MEYQENQTGTSSLSDPREDDSPVSYSTSGSAGRCLLTFRDEVEGAQGWRIGSTLREGLWDFLGVENPEHGGVQ